MKFKGQNQTRINQQKGVLSSKVCQKKLSKRKFAKESFSLCDDDSFQTILQISLNFTGAIWLAERV